MARKKPKARSPAARVPIADEEIVGWLQEHAPEVLTAALPEVLFNHAIEGLLKAWPLPEEMPHFYCRKCGQYHLKTHAHYASQATIT